ncbi:MAG: hypothetical protein ABI785_03295 [Gemmatimonadales bacterium]
MPILSTMGIFITYPWLAAVLGVVLLAVGGRPGGRAATVAGVMWLLYALYETGMKQRWLCTGECNIRVDLLLVYPMLMVLTVVAAVSLLRAGARTKG